jgi:hypothetical protein
MERKLDEAYASTKSVDAKVDHLKSLNKHFLLPSFGGKKAARKEEEFRRNQENKEFSSRSAAIRDKEWEVRNERVRGYQSSSASGSNAGSNGRGASSANRSFYSTPDGLDRDEQEEEIDDNLGQISSGISRLKMMGLAMSTELDSHQDQIKRINTRTEDAQVNVKKLNGKVDSIMDKKKPGWFSSRTPKASAPEPAPISERYEQGGRRSRN